MIKYLTLFLTSLLLLLSVNCSSSKKSVKDNVDDEDSLYVFDEIPLNIPAQNNGMEENNESSGIIYYIQLGAFSEQVNAETFADESSKIINEATEVVYNSETHLYQVRLKSSFTILSKAETVRDRIKQNGKFADVWIMKSGKK